MNLIDVKSHPKLKIACNEENSDLIVLNNFLLNQSYKIKYPEKTALIDQRDTKKLLDVDTLLYFKRSVITNNKKKFVKYNRNVIPISYCITNICLKFKNVFNKKRDIDLSCFFGPNEHNNVDGKISFRGKISNFIKKQTKEKLKNYNFFIGIAGKDGKIGRNTFQKEYFDKLLNSKIVVTCNPDYWEGDYRLFEALSSGCLVIVDKMMTPVKHPFIDGKHLIYYDRENLKDLLSKIEYYLEHPKEARKIAKNGYKFALKYHTPKNRLDEIIEEFNSQIF